MALGPVKSTEKPRFIYPKWRLYLLPIIVFVPLLVIVFQATKMVILESSVWDERRKLIVNRSINQSEERGLITDKNGMLLAGNALYYELGFDAQRFLNVLDRKRDRIRKKYEGERVESVQMVEQLKQAETAAQNFLMQTGSLLDIKLNLYQYALKHPKQRYLSLNKRIKPALADQLFELMKQSGYDAFSLQGYSKRVYPSGGSHLVGLLNADGEALIGAERWFDRQLEARAGQTKITWSGENDFSQKRIVRREVTQTAEKGEFLALTVDQRIQYITQKYLKEAYLKHQAKSASAVILNPKTGAILALASEPAFNANDSKTWQAKRLRNHVLLDIIEPGSTAKPATLLAGLHTNVISMNSTVNANKSYRVDGFTISDPVGYGELDVAGVLKKSSNIGALKFGKKIGKEKLWAMHNLLGWGNDNALYSHGNVDWSSLDHYDSWSQTDLLIRTYGYGFTLKLLDLARLYMSIAADGVLHFPYVVSASKPEPASYRLFSPVIAKQMRAAMMGVAERGGTAPQARVKHFKVAGKTGTVVLKERNRYRYRALFAGMLPAESPELVMLVVIEHDKEENNYYGGDSAAPLFAKVMEQVTKILGIQPYVGAAKLSLADSSKP